MRIVLVSDSYPPLIGGATRFTQQLAHQLVARGHELTVITSWQAGQPAREDDAGVDVVRVRDLTSRVPAVSSDATRHTPPPWPDPAAVRAIRRVLRAVGPDVVHAYGWLTYSCAVAMTGLDAALVLSTQDYGLVCPKRTLVYRDGSICSGPGWRKCLGCAGEFYGLAKGTAATAGVLAGRRLLVRRADAASHNSTYTQGRMHDGIPGLAALPQAVDVAIAAFAEPVGTEAGPDEQILAALPREPYILYVGAFRLIKGIDVLLEAYGRLATPPPLVLMGTRAPDTPPLGGARVHVVEGAQNATVMAAWDRALFGVAPSRLAEPLGIVVHEAMSRGRPVIGSAVGGHPDMIVDGVTGLVTPNGDVAALAAALQRLVDDPAGRAAMGEAARERARAYEADALVPRYEELYRAAIRARETG